jgi:hypothetical protein
MAMPSPLEVSRQATLRPVPEIDLNGNGEAVGLA